MDDAERRAREMLAAEFDDPTGYAGTAIDIRRGSFVGIPAERAVGVIAKLIEARDFYAGRYAERCAPQSEEPSADYRRGLDELRKLSDRATAGEWMVQDGCSWRRIGTHMHDGDVLCPIVQRDGHPDLIAADGKRDANMRFIVAAINFVRQALAQPEPTSGESDHAQR